MEPRIKQSEESIRDVRVKAIDELAKFAHIAASESDGPTRFGSAMGLLIVESLADGDYKSLHHMIGALQNINIRSKGIKNEHFEGILSGLCEVAAVSYRHAYNRAIPTLLSQDQAGVLLAIHSHPNITIDDLSKLEGEENVNRTVPMLLSDGLAFITSRRCYLTSLGRETAEGVIELKGKARE